MPEPRRESVGRRESRRSEHRTHLVWRAPVALEARPLRRVVRLLRAREDRTKPTARRDAGAADCEPQVAEQIADAVLDRLGELEDLGARRAHAGAELAPRRDRRW